jgi:murein L,D-transpeptidase YcbB/YkuD
MSTWTEDFNHSLETLGLPSPGDFDAVEAYDFISDLVEGIELTEQGATVAEALGALAAAEAAAAAAETAGAAMLLTASFYGGALIGAAIYATGKQAWDELTSPIDIEQLLEWSKQYEAPIIELPPDSEEVSWYPETTTAHEDAPPAAPDYPGHVIKSHSTDTDSVERIQTALAASGYDVEVDGKFGSDTEAAVEAFQEAQGLDVDGKVGKDTWAALFASAPVAG